MNRVSIVGLREAMKQKFPESALTEVLRHEPDFLEPEQFLAKVPTWLSLTRINK
jgi:hypothetical protein